MTSLNFIEDICAIMISDPAITRSPLDILRTYWGYEKFRPLQEDIIRSVLEGNDTLALLPTGGGKSICYQVPALMTDGLCLVISPLIALMKDQVEGLKRKNITAFSIFSGMQRRDVINTLKVAGSSNCKFLYVSPERLETSLFKEYLPGLDVKLIAVDEAHCISQWGYDFRPPYLRIAALRKELPGIPVLALTATATKAVQEDICEKLEFRAPRIFRQSFERPNLSYSAFKTSSRINRIIDILGKVKGSAIVYCKSRKRTKEIADLLKLQQISADHYHAGLTAEERNIRQESWIKDATRVIVCTNAFGMGIDKPAVRLVIHADAPDCLENYYQEAGRAGRDGQTAYAVLLYDETDLSNLEILAEERFPGLSKVREVYQALANYLQIPAYEKPGASFDFDITDFLRKFKLKASEVIYSLRMLEQDGWISFSDQVFRSSTIQFTANRQQLNEFEKAEPELDNLVKTLLRAYEGIFDQPVFISEKMIASLLKKTSEVVVSNLKFLTRAGIISYEPPKDQPQITLLKSRVKAEDLAFDLKAIQKRKEEFLARISEMRKFIMEDWDCRSRMIATYFGDLQTRACGICDNCLKKKSAKLSKEEFDALHHRILNLVKYEHLTIKAVLDRLAGVKKEKAWKVIDFLQSENKITVNDKGIVVLN